jgi:D-alanyl-D-alanine carboxypeptidase (penicillin-binding protein 5/6)
LFFLAPSYAASNAGPPSAPGNHAKGASLIDVSSGRILFSQRGDEPMKIASLTKIMTAIVAIEHGNLDDRVTVSVRAAGKEGSSLYLKAGEKMTLRNLLYGMMLRSGNDAAVAVAEHVGGSEGGFAYLMNRKAEQLGLVNSHFANPHGLDQAGHYMSANDLARLTAYCLKNATFRNIVKTRLKSAPNPHETWDYKWVNKNKMLAMYEGADGVKTGYTKQALRTLVSSATRSGRQLAAVTLNDGNDWSDHRSLLDYGFKHFPLAEVVQAGEPVAGHPYAVSASFRYPFADGEQERLRIKLAPLNPGTPAYLLGYRGQLRFVLDDKIIGSVPLTELKADRERADTVRQSHASVDQASEVRSSLTFADRFGVSIQALLFDWTGGKGTAAR